MLQHPDKTYKRAREINGGAFQEFRVNQLWEQRYFTWCGCSELGNQARRDCVECVEIPQQLVGSGECCPCGLHSVISRLLAGGSLVSALCICCFLAHRLLYGTLWFVVSLLFYIAIPIPEVIQCYHLAFSNQLPMNWSADLRPCWFLFLFWFGLFAFCVSSVLFVFVFLVFVFCLARWQLNGLCIDPFQFSFVLHCHYDQCCYCINSVNLHNAIVFPAW